MREALASLILEQPAAAGLADDGRLRGSIIIKPGMARRRIVAFGDARCRDATIGVGRVHCPVLGHGDVVEVQQISCATRTGCAIRAHHTELHWIVGSGINGEPALSTVISRGDISVPHTLEWSAAVGASAISSRRCAEEEEGCAIIVAGNHFGKTELLIPNGMPTS